MEICLDQGFDLQFLASQGYYALSTYIQGVESVNNTFIGWAGNQGLNTSASFKGKKGTCIRQNGLKIKSCA